MLYRVVYWEHSQRLVVDPLSSRGRTSGSVPLQVRVKQSAAEGDHRVIEGPQECSMASKGPMCP